MQKQFVQFINQHKLFKLNNKVLIAVSGGADSVVLLHLMLSCGYNVAIAHCNFNLRAAESDSDEEFVRVLAKKYNIKSHFKSFNTIVYANENKVSIEMAARDLRYSWFNSLLKEYAYDYLATGHHLNDSIETLFLNLTRGTGYAGLTGISPKNGNIIRPLLFATRKAIEAYAKVNALNYRNDSSNNSDKHMRNIVRNQIIPLFENINPGFQQVMAKNLENFNQAATILDAYFDEYRKKALTTGKLCVEIPFYKIVGKKPIKIHLFQLVQQFGFNRDTVARIIEAMENEPGKMFYSETHRLLIDRDSLLITEEVVSESQSLSIRSFEEFNLLPNIKVKKLPFSKFEIIRNNKFACIDADKLDYPLTIRKWEQGEYFYPLGMEKRKKISDFLIDTKVNRIEKENTLVLANKSNQIIWIIGKRLDNRFKVTDKTETVLVLEC